MWVQEASEIAHEAAEAVLKPQTSESYYSEEPASHTPAHPEGGGNAAAHPAAEDDRFLSLATGEAQADAPHVGQAPLESSALEPSMSQLQLNPEADSHAAEHHPSALYEPAQQPASEHKDGQDAPSAALAGPSAVIHSPAPKLASDQDSSLDHLGCDPTHMQATVNAILAFASQGE